MRSVDPGGRPVWGAAGAGGSPALVLRDTVAPGGTAPDASKRLYAMQAPDGSVTAVADSSGVVKERYLYTPDGQVTVLNAAFAPLTGSDGKQVFTSALGWRYTFRGGRDDGGGALDPDGRHLVYVSGVEADPVSGGTLGEDPQAYQASKWQHTLDTTKASYPQADFDKALVIGAATVAAVSVTVLTFGTAGPAAFGSLIAGMTTLGFVNAAADRYEAGQTVGESLLGGAADATPIGPIVKGAFDVDPGTGKELGWSGDRRAASIAVGVAEAALMAAGISGAAGGGAAAEVAGQAAEAGAACRLASAAVSAGVRGGVGGVAGGALGAAQGYAETGTAAGALASGVVGAAAGLGGGAADGAAEGWDDPFVCFAAGTPVLVAAAERGPGPASPLLESRPIEQVRKDDRVLSRPEHHPEAPPEFKVVEEVFVRRARTVALTVGRHEVRVTAEHPFFVDGRGWVAAGELLPGDLLCGHDGARATVSSAGRNVR